MAAVGVSIGWSIGTYKGGHAPTGPGPQVLRSLVEAFEVGAVEASKWGQYLFPNLTAALEAVTEKQFAAQGHGTTGGWMPLSPEYARWKNLHWPGRPILVLTGALREALTNSGASGALRETTPTTMAYGTQGIEYASYHQGGAPDVNLPARPPVDFAAGDRELIIEAADLAARELRAVARLNELESQEWSPKTETASMFGPMTKAQTSAAKGRVTRIAKLRALRRRKEDR